MAWARASGSFAAAIPTARSVTAMTSATPIRHARLLWRCAIGVCQERLDLRRERLFRHRADVFMDDAALPVDEERLRHAVHAVVDRYLPQAIDSVGKRLLEPGDEVARRSILVLNVYPNHGEAAVAVPVPNPLQVRGFLVACRKAPGSPEVDHHDPAAQHGCSQRPTIKQRKAEFRRLPANERGGDDTRIAMQSEDQHQQNR